MLGGSVSGNFAGAVAAEFYPTEAEDNLYDTSVTVVSGGEGKKPGECGTGEGDRTNNNRARVMWTVRFLSGPNGIKMTESQKVADGDAATEPDVTVMPVLEHSEYTGEWKRSDGTVYRFKYDKITEDTDLFPEIKGEKTCLIALTDGQENGQTEIAEAYLSDAAGWTAPECLFMPPTGMEFEGWEYGDLIYEPGQTVALVGELKLNARWKWIEYTVFAANGKETEEIGKAHYGDTFRFFIYPEPGQETVSANCVGASGVNVEVTAEEDTGLYSLIMPGENVTLSASFRTVSYAVTATGLEHATLLVNNEQADLTGDVTAYYGDIITIRPDEGYLLAGPEVKDAALDDVAVENGSFTMPAMDVSVHATCRKLMTNSDIMITVPAREYTGSALTSAVTVRDGDTTLQADADYTVGSWSDEPVNAGTYTATLTGAGDYEGTAEASFTILPKPVTVTAKAQTVGIGGSIATGTEQATLTGAVEGHYLTAVTLTAGSTASATDNGTITPGAATIRDGSGNDVTDNYDITYEDGTLTVTDLVQEDTPNAVFAATGSDTGTLSGLVNGGQYTVIGATPSSFTVSGSSQKIKGVSAGKLIIIKKADGSGTRDSDAQEISISKAEAPAGLEKTDCASASNNDGTITGVKAAMEYKKSDGEWAACSDSSITGLKPGVYYVRVGATGTTLASDNVTMAIDTYAAPGQVKAPVFDPVAGTYTDTQRVELTSSTEGAIIYYTINGDAPDKAGMVFTGPISVSETSTIRAIAVKDGMKDSFISEATYTIRSDQAVTKDPAAIRGLVYNGTAQALITAGEDTEDTFRYALGDADGPAQPYTTSIPTATDAGTYHVWYIAEESLSYDGVSANSISVSIGKKTLTVTADEKSKTFGEDDPELTYKTEGLVSGNVIEGKLERDEGENVGTYGIGIGTLSAGDNYEIHFVPATFTVSAADADVNSPSANSLTYNGAEQRLVTEGTVSGGSILYRLGDGGYSEDIPVAKDAGTYTVFCYVSGDENHNDTQEEAISVTILKKGLVITAEDKSKVYKDPDPELTYTAEGLVAGDEITGKLSRNGGEGIGTYVIGKGTLDAGENYSITFNGAELDIVCADKTPLTDAVTEAGKYYDSIKDNEKYKDTANVLKKAMDEAEEVLAKNELSTADVTGAAAALKRALDMAKSEIWGLSGARKEETAVSPAEINTGKTEEISNLLIGKESKTVYGVYHNMYDTVSTDIVITEGRISAVSLSKDSIKAGENYITFNTGTSIILPEKYSVSDNFANPKDYRKARRFIKNNKGTYMLELKPLKSAKDRSYRLVLTADADRNKKLIFDVVDVSLNRKDIAKAVLTTPVTMEAVSANAVNADAIGEEGYLTKDGVLTISTRPAVKTGIPGSENRSARFNTCIWTVAGRSVGCGTVQTITKGKAKVYVMANSDGTLSVAKAADSGKGSIAIACSVNGRETLSKGGVKFKSRVYKAKVKVQ